MLLVVGVFGYLFRLFSIPIAPLILAVVLGEMLEQRFRQALSVSDGNPMIFLHSGICMFLAGLTIFVVFFPILKKVLASRRGVRLAPNR
jgi:putative tricarboxylic transport membrane protein